jgi:hypothetical protein
LRINGQPIALNNGATRTTCPYGHAVVFQADCSGRLPPGGRAELRTPAGAAMGVTLEPLANREGGYGGQMARLVESVRYQVYLGDAWTDPAWLEVVPLPVVDLELIVTPPVYSGAEERPAVLGGLRQVSVLEGSRVDVRIACDKPLRSAAITLDGRPLAMRRDVSARPAAAAERWLLPSAGTPLEAVTDAVRYSLQVTDRDGLELERPLVGVIRIKPDDPPRIVAGAVTRYVLPAAQPSIVFEAADDHGLAKIAARSQVTRAGGQVETGEELTVYVRQEPHPLETSIQNRYRLDLAPWGLAKGDRVEVTLEATDFRGPRAGKAGQAEPIVFEVTDQQGILAAMSESDRESAQQLETMIERQLDVGEER